ncbi:MAG: hypothetical protein ACI9N9_001977, partial [Enterobacterales bacterium]
LVVLFTIRIPNITRFEAVAHSLFQSFKGEKMVVHNDYNKELWIINWRH